MINNVEFSYGVIKNLRGKINFDYRHKIWCLCMTYIYIQAICTVYHVKTTTNKTKDFFSGIDLYQSCVACVGGKRSQQIICSANAELLS